VIVLCQEGYSSSLAAARLQSLGLHRATDVIGGFDAWRDARLPVERVSAKQ
jgi:rhodanese-related sulfurtransferase